MCYSLIPSETGQETAIGGEAERGKRRGSRQVGMPRIGPISPRIASERPSLTAEPPGTVPMRYGANFAFAQGRWSDHRRPAVPDDRLDLLPGCVIQIGRTSIEPGRKRGENRANCTAFCTA
jgi:hypothetical protein